MILNKNCVKIVSSYIDGNWKIQEDVGWYEYSPNDVMWIPFKKIR